MSLRETVGGLVMNEWFIIVSAVMAAASVGGIAITLLLIACGKIRV